MIVATKALLKRYPPAAAESAKIQAAINNRRKETKGNAKRATVWYTAKLRLGAGSKLSSIPVKVSIRKGNVAEIAVKATGAATQARCLANYKFAGSKANKSGSSWSLALGAPVTAAAAANCKELSLAELRSLAAIRGMKLVPTSKAPAAKRKTAKAPAGGRPRSGPGSTSERDTKAKKTAAKKTAPAKRKAPAKKKTAAKKTAAPATRKATAKRKAPAAKKTAATDSGKALTAVPSLGQPVRYETGAGWVTGFYVGRGTSGASKGKLTVRATASLQGRVKAVSSQSQLHKPSTAEAAKIKPVAAKWLKLNAARDAARAKAKAAPKAAPKAKTTKPKARKPRKTTKTSQITVADLDF